MKRHRGEGCSETPNSYRAFDSHSGKQDEAPQDWLSGAAEHDHSPSFARSCRKGGTRFPWTKATVGELVTLQAAQPKVSSMPHPAGDVDAWIALAVENKESCRQCVKPVLTHLGSKAMETGETVRCPTRTSSSTGWVRIEHGCMVCSGLPGQWWAAHISALCAGSSSTRGKE